MNNTQKTIVQLEDRSYEILIGERLLNFISLPVAKNSSVAIITNTTIAKLYLETINNLLNEKNIKHFSIILEDGEKYKNIDSMNQIWTQMLQNKCDRKTCIIALGGGVIGDMAGFAAATYMRGIDFIQIPTTLLAQTDSSVGGKTGINHSLGKNMIGSFHQPKQVVIDISTLQTLPQEEISAGLAEVIKYACIFDFAFFEYLEKNMHKILQLDSETLAYIIKKSCDIKAEIVAKDEKEANLRATLNFGHTFGHAIEAFMGYGTFLHGQAVSIGMVMAAKYSTLTENLSVEQYKRIIALLKQANLPTTPPQEMKDVDFIKYMLVDKKTENDNLNLILINQIGSCLIRKVAVDETLTTTLNFDYQAE